MTYPISKPTMLLLSNMKTKNKIWRASLALLFVIFSSVSAQNPLSRKVNIDIYEAPISMVLSQLEIASGYTFSYNSTLFDDTEEISLSVTNASMESVLDKIFDKKLDYRIVNNHIILLPAKSSRQKKSTIMLTGHITDDNSNPIESAIIYTVAENATAITSENGSYKLSLKPQGQTVSLTISHPSCVDTIIYIDALDQTLDIKLNIVSMTTVDTSATERDSLLSSPRLESISTGQIIQANTLEDNKLVDIFVPKDAMYVSDNLFIYDNVKPIQISFLPFVGTNFLSNGISTNKVSFNIISGYSNGLDGIEIGGFVNIVRNEALGVQLAGFANIVGNGAQVVQASGFANIVNGQLTGIQASGFVNVANGHVDAVQAAGFFNFSSKDMFGVQVSGFGNYSGEMMRGVQLASVLNVSRGYIDGSQISGLVNVAVPILKNNVEEELHNSVQISSLVNFDAQRSSRLQVSVLNIGSSPNATQVGIVNLADSIDNGVQLGLLNFARRCPFRVLDIQRNDFSDLDISYKSGNHHFYSIINLNFGDYFGAGLGLGITTNNRRRVSCYAELISGSLIDVDNYIDVNDSFGMTNNVKMGINIRATKRLSLTFGPSINTFMPFNYDETIIDWNNDISFERSSVGRISKALANRENTAWMGWFGGIRYTFQK